MDDKKTEDKKINAEDDNINKLTELIYNYLSKSMKIKLEKWSKALASDDCLKLIRAFFKAEEVSKLIININQMSSLSVASEFPIYSKSKSMYFIRVFSEPLVPENFRNSVIFGDMSSQPIDQLEVLIENVFIPLLANNKNHGNWPILVKEDVKKQVYAFRNSIYQVKGALKSETILPMPAGYEETQYATSVCIETNGREVNLTLKASIETAFMQWSSLCNNILEQSSSLAFAEGFHPTPMAEIDFWKARLKNLESVYKQLRDPQVKMICKYLELTKSSYLNCFKYTFQNVVAGVIEARDICVYLKPLKVHFDRFLENQFLDNKVYIKPLAHVLGLLWGNSRYYCNTARMINLLKEVSNMLIHSVITQLDPISIFHCEPQDSYQKIESCLELINLFIFAFEKVRGNISNYFKFSKMEVKSFPFHTKYVFHRIFMFIERLLMIQKIFEISNDFQTLEKIEVGGIGGRVLSFKCKEILNEFNQTYNLHFINIQYNSLDIENGNIIMDYNEFMIKCSELERKLIAIFEKIFDDCYNTENIFKFINMAGILLNRNIIRKNVSEKYKKILNYFNGELEAVTMLYNEGKNREIPVDKNFPPTAGKIWWLHKLKHRILKPGEDLGLLEHDIANSSESEFLLLRWKELLEIFENEQKIILKTWSENLSENINASLKKTQLKREKCLLELNIDKEIITILKEVKYMKMINIQNIPSEASQIFERNEEFNQHFLLLNRIIEWYNYLKEKTLTVEYGMIADEVEVIDTLLYSFSNIFTWNNIDIQAARKLYTKLQVLHDRIVQIQENISKMVAAIESWGFETIFERKDKNKKSLLFIEDRTDQIRKRYDQIAVTSKKVHLLIQENYNLLFVSEEEKNDQNYKKGCNDENPKDKDLHVSETKNETETQEKRFTLSDNKLKKWISYENYVDKLISSKIIEAAMFSLYFFIKETSIRDNPRITPLFEMKLELRDHKIVHIYTVQFKESCGLLNFVEILLDDIICMGKYMKRISNSNNKYLDYYQDIMTDKQVTNICREIKNRISLGVSDMNTYVKKFQEYAHIWQDNRQIFLKHFLMQSCFVFRNVNNTKFGSNKGNLPKLIQFREQINLYEEMYKKITKIEDQKIVNGWLKIDVKPLRQGILNEVIEWGNLFKQYLFNYVTNSIQELEKFIDVAVTAMQVKLSKNDYDGLLNVMSYLIKVRNRQTITDGMCTSLKEVIDLLKDYDVEFDEEIHVRLQELPCKWSYCKKVAIKAKQIVAPLKAVQASAIRKRILLFDTYQSNYRDVFKRKQFFFWECDNVYEMLDKANTEIKSLEIDLGKLTEQANLFDISLSEYKHLRSCRRELKHLKNLWDFINIVTSYLNEWTTTPWKNIDAEDMELELKKFSKEIRAMDKEVRSWNLYLQMEANIKNMLTSLRAVTELQNPSIRDRHWLQLMQATKVNFSMDDSTTLSDLLKLNLHEYEEEVKNIVDKSIKEMAMEKVLKELDQTWLEMKFEVELHDRTKLKLLRASEEMIDILEDNQVQLQNMMTSKFIQFFYNEVSEWQRRLSNVDQIVQIFFEVQRKWCYLESIFIGSEDIRSQLPVDSDRFDCADREFKIVLADMVSILNVIESTCNLGLNEKLSSSLNNLILCEKALNNYLETKRVAFPRFYFVASSDLLDILSNGNRPDLIVRHLPKLFDSLAKLKFCQKSEEHFTKAVEMGSKENDEWVSFVEECHCSGKVEIWLNQLINVMRKTLHHLVGDAVTNYDEKPRDAWIFDYPAQAALCGTQIWWTNEVNMAFARLEEGYENALKDYQKKQITQLNTLITLLLGDLSAGERQKIMTICTIDVHSRDVVAKMIQVKVENSQAFQWQSQLRHRWDNARGDCFADICDAQFKYQYEYLGNTPRLVITPLTDRCYITLTQSLHLVMGGAPAGPAGTGKTETTKDLGKGLGTMVYVFNCSEQMDYKSVGNIFKGLSQTGTWGCFDEFNRISVEVLSVIAVQVKSIQDAIKANKTRFIFQEEDIFLLHTVGTFITMNPGYAGRTELPENLKALFRPCAMVVPDFALISEIMLVTEGFQEARVLAKKFITLYTLCKELLSNQDHYDWGLRAIKSVLVIAGSLRRIDKHRPEDQVLMRALRDFNIPKIVTDDIPVFLGLIGDLFPSLEVPRKRNLEFEKLARKSAIDLKLQPEENFILKVVQLEELLAVRHSVFILGYAGTGKSCVWKALHKTYVNQKLKPVCNDLNPKAVTNDELFGVINPTTREWKDGLFSVIMREQANMLGDSPKWIVLDGDIDPMWIESLNTLMDDNKVLTLASNERIALTKHMRLLFEIENLKTATPATVSRAGILYINPGDLGWNPYVASWTDTRLNPNEKTHLSVLFDKYVPQCLEFIKSKVKKITPVSDIAHVYMLCSLLDCLLTPQNIPLDCPKEWYELYFVFALIWSFGSSLIQDQLVNWRIEFTKWFKNEFKSIKFPSGDDVFHYYLDNESKRFLPWKELVPKFQLNSDLPLQDTIVNTFETVRIRYFIDLLIENKRPVMLVGNAGSGKTALLQSKLQSLSEKYAVKNIPFNFYTTAEMLQKTLEDPLEKKAGRVYGPPSNKTMIYFIDDMNMPEIDRYYTVQPHTLIRQWLDYKHWYDRQKLILKDIHNVQFVSCMNPTAGSFTINPRLQRHFCVFTINFPSQEALHHIYTQILTQHVCKPSNNFPLELHKLSFKIVSAALLLHSKVSQVFLPTAHKFHYVFNLRDLSNVFQGILFATGDAITCKTEFIRLWIHESLRVYEDKLVDRKDIENYNKFIMEVTKKEFEDLDESGVFEKPLLFCHFAEGFGDPKYVQIKDYVTLKKLLEGAQANYNDMVAAMNLVLFEDAMNHICRINRMLESPRGNGLLIGVGGSGKQSLTMLSAFISSLDVFQIQLKKGYTINDLKLDVSQLYVKAGLKNLSTVFLITDSQVAREEWLVVINDMLASGEISGLLTDEDTENIMKVIRTELKAVGSDYSRENCWKCYIERCRKLIKIMLCFSPVGATLRIRARKFPAIFNCTFIDWFHEWPKGALLSVSQNFLANLEVLPKELIQPVSQFMAYTHSVANKMSEIYLINDRRYNYTTPKTFLEQIFLYQKLLTEKCGFLKYTIARLESGLLKLASTADEVESLKTKLAVQELELNEKNEAADKFIVVITAENDKLNIEKEITTKEEEKVKIIEEDVTLKAKVCAEDLAKAEPALVAAQDALNTLNKNNLTELKSFGNPPQAVVNVTAAVLVLFSKKGKISKDRSWKACKIMMGKADEFLYQLINYDKENMSQEVVNATKEYLKDPEFCPDVILSKSIAASGLCSWVINILKYYEVFVVVEPKRKALLYANKELTDATTRLKEVKTHLKSLEDKLEALKTDFDEAMNAKMKCQAEADGTTLMIELANRLVNGLASENVRWKESVKNSRKIEVTLPGDVLLATAFISYVGCFTRKYRLDMMENYWLSYLQSIRPEIPLTNGLDPLALLTDDAQVAKWNNEGLPSDRMSSENATILINSSRWPLMIDPQLQGQKWIKTKYGSSLSVVRMTSKNYLDAIEKCVSNGKVLLLENIGETLDSFLDPLLGRILIKKGRAIKLGDKEIDYNPKFRLILHTKLANPHYKPEIQAQTTLINFTVTRDGLEEQLLAQVVKIERPDLELLKSSLTKQQNDFKITLKVCEDNLLQRLSSATGNILNDVTLIENLEKTKKTAADIAIKISEAKTTSAQIDEAREQYRPAAVRGSLLYFILSDLYKINAFYQFSLKSFTAVFLKALEDAAPSEKLSCRVKNLLESITYLVFLYTNRGLFECDKLIFSSQMVFQILLRNQEIKSEELDFLLRFPVLNVTSPLDFLSKHSWGGIKSLSNMNEFKNLDRDTEGSANRWKKFVECECPEKERLPGEWKNKSSLQKLCIMRALRPDRMSYAIKNFIEEKMGSKFINSPAVPFAKSYEETVNGTPIFFILSPGVNPLKDVEILGQKLGFSMAEGNFHCVSLGQGQEIVAERALHRAAEMGHWVVLQNIHLVERWLATLEKKIEKYDERSHSNYRLYLSADNLNDPQECIIPQSILESSIKITNEPPTGMYANLHKALDNFNQETLEMCTKESEFKVILFSLCYFHAVVAERRKFGPQGWNRNYPFNLGDLSISVSVLYNYLEGNVKIPWDDLRYLFGEIMYGGHITDDWDRRLCRTYLLEYIQPNLLDGDLMLAPGFTAPPNMDYEGYHNYIDDHLPQESPHLYGLHPNAEIGFLSNTSERLFRSIFNLQPRDTLTSTDGCISRGDKVKCTIEEILEKFPEEFQIAEMVAKVEDRSPFVVVVLQECERMNTLIREIKKSLLELSLGLKGELTITSEMDVLEEAIYMNKVPKSWSQKAYPSMSSLSLWLGDLSLRIKELENWVSDFQMPPSVWLGGLFNPQSFLTAIMQQTARKTEWPLDKMCLLTDVTKKTREDFTTSPREGVYVHGLYMEGARWDTQFNCIAESKLKELYPVMPIIYIKATTHDTQELRNMYCCPVYKTLLRGTTFVWTFNLKTKDKSSKWILAGVALLLQT